MFGSGADGVLVTVKEYLTVRVFLPQLVDLVQNELKCNRLVVGVNPQMDGL